MLFAFCDASPRVHETAYIAPTATVLGQVELGANVSIWFNAVLRGDINSISVGRDTNIQDGCILHVTNVHPVVVGERITVGHAVVLHGCTVESDCLVGIGALVLDGALIGSGSVIAAGTVVPPEMLIPPQSLVMGIPGKIVRQVHSEDRQRISEGWKHYIEHMGNYKKHLRRLDLD